MKIEIYINDKTVNLFKKVFTKRNIIVITAFILFSFCLIVFGQQFEQLFQFKSGDIISSDKVNKNFKILSDRIDSLEQQAPGFGSVPIGTIVGWHKSMPGTPILPIGWVECNGQTLQDTASPYNGQVIPNLNSQVYAGGRGRYLRGGMTSGILNDSTQFGDNGTNYIIPFSTGGGYYGACFHSITYAEGPSRDGLVYSETPHMNFRFQVTAMTVVWIMRVK